ncbi:hypothetical protein [Flavobacterium cerinum]|uniref:Uncharacterized protein n=1 Tax=Flavobacterium cerinum TaxID=2502784 RepID=A0A444GLC9_9FLAO|nr:hypothetical protein [Flavobacterium cerinum]RWW91777.1 hypothetical protein EPI11_18005 [Flavobacterium cerinum]
MKKIILLAFITFSVSIQAQSKDNARAKLELFPEEKLDFPQYQNNIAKVCFSNEDFSRTLPENKYIKTYNLGDNLSVRAFMANSPANSAMLQLFESGIKPKEINGNKSTFERCKVAFILYVDENMVSGTSHAETFEREDMTGLPTMRAELNDGTEKNFFGESMYRKLLERQDLLTPGTHKLKIELVPVIMGDATGFEYKPIAVGEIDMVVPKEIKVTAADCFPKSAMNDPKLEAEVLKACKNYFKENAGNAVKAILAFEDIYIVRGDYNAIIKKSFIAAIACKNSKGEVWYDYYIFDKMYDGSKYLPAKVSSEATVNGRFAPDGKKVNAGCLKFLK